MDAEDVFNLLENAIRRGNNLIRLLFNPKDIEKVNEATSQLKKRHMCSFKDKIMK
jgi:hypothetical protein